MIFYLVNKRTDKELKTIKAKTWAGVWRQVPKNLRTDDYQLVKYENREAIGYGD